MKKHEILTGHWGDGLVLLDKRGGQLFPQRNIDGAVVHTSGNVISTLWPQNSRTRGRVTQLASQIGFEHPAPTGGRISRYITDGLIGIPWKGTYFSPQWAKRARSGAHWHYLYAKEGVYDYCVEIDVKSAYWRSFLTGQSCLLGQGDIWLDDGGAMENLRVLMDTLPKWVRLSLLGSWASHEQKFYVQNPDGSTPYDAKLKVRKHIEHGALFNATHRAIARTWLFMKRLHEIVGEDTVRIHTDGIVCNAVNGMDWEQELEDEFKKWGLDYSIKGHGHAWIMDVNSGVLGCKIMGERRYLREEAIKRGIKIDRRRAAPFSHDWFTPLPSSEPTEVSMEPVAIEAQTSLPLSL